jgi:hypothetical protein
VARNTGRYRKSTDKPRDLESRGLSLFRPTVILQAVVFVAGNLP